MDHLFADETILARWLNNELTAAELQALQEHEAYADLQAIVREMDHLQLREERDVEADYAALQKVLMQGSGVRSQETEDRSEVRGNREQETGGRRRLLVWRWAAVAAVVVIAVATWLWWQPQPTTYLTEAGERQEIVLPDGSQVVLNAVSELKVYEGGWNENRSVALSGEAFFEVEPGTPFTISTASGQVEVLGTSFNVYARNGILESLCTSGSIRTSSKDGTVSQVSTAGQGVRLSNNQLELTFDVNPQNSLWPDGQSRFEAAPLGRVIAELKRQFSIDIQYDQALISSEDAITVWFNNQNLEEALRNVFRPMRIAYEQEGDVVYLRAE